VSEYAAKDSEGEPNPFSPKGIRDKPGQITDVFSSSQTAVGTSVFTNDEEGVQVFWAGREAAEKGRKAVGVAGDFYRYGWIDPSCYAGGDFGKLGRILKDDALKQFMENPQDVALFPAVVDDVASVDVGSAQTTSCIFFTDIAGKPLYTVVKTMITFSLTTKSTGEVYNFTQVGEFWIDPKDNKILTMHYQWKREAGPR